MTTINTSYSPVDAVRTGVHGEMTLNVSLPENAEYLIAKSPTGVVVAVPKNGVPECEWDLWEDPKIRAELWNGFDDAVSGRVSNLDDVLAELDLADA